MEHCRRFLFFNVSVMRNSASHAAGWFSSSPDALVTICNISEEDRANIMESQGKTIEIKHRHQCENITDNHFLDGSGGLSADFGTRAIRLAMEGWDGRLKEVKSQETLVVPCANNSDSSCTSRPLRIAVKDIFNRTIAQGIDDANLTLLLESDAISGERRYTAVNGIAEIRFTKAKGFGVSSNLIVLSERDPELHVDIPFSIRECYPGEIQGDTCTSCHMNQYSFRPEEGSCQPCERDAICKGGANRVPKQGYWHSTPFSPVFRACIQKEACSYDGREDSLGNLLNGTDDDPKAVHLQEILREFDESRDSGQPPPDFSVIYPQCRTGYRGLLCGSCAPRYGRSVSRSCRSCPEHHATCTIYICLVMGWLFLLIGFNCGITLASMNSRVDLVQYEQEKNLASRQELPLSHQNARKQLEQPTTGILSTGTAAVLPLLCYTKRNACLVLFRASKCVRFSWRSSSAEDLRPTAHCYGSVD